MFIIYKSDCYVFVKVGSGSSSASLCRGGDGPVCLRQPMVVVNRWRRLSALGLGKSAAGTGYSPSADCSPPTRTIPRENRWRDTPAGIPSSPVRGAKGAAERHGCHRPTQPPCRAVPDWTDSPFGSKHGCQSCTVRPVQYTGHQSHSNLDWKPGFGHRDAGRRCLARSSQVPTSVPRPTTGRTALVCGVGAVQETFPGGKCRDGMCWHAPCRGANALSDLVVPAPEASKDDQEAGRYVLARPDSVSASEGRERRSRGSHVGCQDGQGLGSGSRATAPVGVGEMKPSVETSFSFPGVEQSTKLKRCPKGFWIFLVDASIHGTE